MTADELIQSLRKRDIICPYPILWNKMVLHFDKILGNKVKLPNPLVLSGWDVSNNYEKRKRFEEHITIISETLGVKTLTRYLDRFVKDTDYYKSDYVDPEEISDMVYELSLWSEVDKVISETEPPLRRLIEIKPELEDDDNLRRYLREYEDDMGLSNYNEKKLRLVHDKSEFRKNIKEIYEIFLKQKEMLRGKDIHDFCSDAVYNLDPIIFDSKKN